MAIKIKVGNQQPNGDYAIVDVETSGVKFYQEIMHKDHAERFVLCWNSHDDLLAALRQFQEAFVHIPGDTTGNKVRTSIIVKCDNIRVALVAARYVIDKAENKFSIINAALHKLYDDRKKH